MASIPTVLAVLVSAAALVVLLQAVTGAPALPHGTVLVLDDGTQLLAAVLATVTCLGVARQAPSQRRHWTLLACGVGCWAAGQAVWTVYEVVLSREVPFPSWADVGFVLFPLVTAAGLLGWLRAADRAAARVRDLVDGAVIAGSLLVLSWVTTLGSVYAGGAPDRLALVLSLAYPVGDVVLATLVVLTLSRAGTPHRGALVLVAAGLGGLAVADSAYVYLMAVGNYGTGDAVSAGWVSGFLLIAGGARTAARADAAVPRHPREDRGVGGGPEQRRPRVAGSVPARASLVLPYVPLLVAEAVVVSGLLAMPGAVSVELCLGIAVAVLVLARQFLALIENRRLLLALEQARDQLRRQALHDPLTGLANRVLFTDRLEHALAVRARVLTEVPARAGQAVAADGGGGPAAVPAVAVLFCDLDDFKAVNDDLGHAAGDELLRQVAVRLAAGLRPEDTVARLGGDEFTVLLERSADPALVARRLVADVARPFVLDGAPRPVQVGLSVGLAYAGRTHPGPDAGASAPRDAQDVAQEAQDLMRQADSAMYLAKARGKGCSVVAGSEDLAAPGDTGGPRVATDSPPAPAAHAASPPRQTFAPAEVEDVVR